MAALRDFERHILPFVDGAPLPAIEDAVRDACVEFCTRTRVLRQILTPITLIAGLAEYQLDAPDGDNKITEVTGAWLPQGKIDPFTRPVLDERYPRGWATLATSDLRDVAGYYCRAPGILRLIPMVTIKVSRALTVEVAYCPTQDAVEVEDVLLDRYAEIIAAGALGRLHQYPGAKYADPTRVATYLSTFEAGITKHADDSHHGFAHQPLRTGRDILS